MHDQDYRTQLERSAHGHGKPIELSEANGEIMTSMAALRQKYINDVNKSLRKLRRRASKVDESRNMVAHSQVTDMNGEGSIAEVRKTKVRDTDNACWASEGVGFTITVSEGICWGETY